MAENSNRQQFIEHTARILCKGDTAPDAYYQDQAALAGQIMDTMFTQKGTLLFQGDSITDAMRSRFRGKHANDPKALGRGYAAIAAQALLDIDKETRLSIFNRGISGDTVFDLLARWERDCIALQPDVISILVGVNDVWHSLQGRYQSNVDSFATEYHTLIERTRDSLPDVALIICEPFVLRCGEVGASWFPDFDRYRDISLQIARQYHARFVSFQSMFDIAIRFAPPAYWADDGVHPTDTSNHLMAQTWLYDVAHAGIKQHELENNV